MTEMASSVSANFLVSLRTRGTRLLKVFQASRRVAKVAEREVMDEKGLWGHKERMPSEGVAWVTQAGIHGWTPGFCSTTEAAD